MHKEFFYKDIEPFLPEYHTSFNVNNYAPTSFSKVSPLSQADSETLVYVDSLRLDKAELFMTTKAGIVICDHDIDVNASEERRVIIQVENPKYVFSMIVNKLFVNRPKPGIHPTAQIHSKAIIHPKAYVGPFSYVGESIVGQGSVIYGNCHIYDGVNIGTNVIIHAGAVIGSDGFGYVRDENKKPIQFPHIGDIIIDDFVEIGANTAIDLGSLGSTKIGFATKIDNLVHIGHNVEIGKCCYVAALTAIAGSTKINDYVEVWMGTSLAGSLKIGDRSTVGIGSVVLRDILEGDSVFGNPARAISNSRGSGNAGIK